MSELNQVVTLQFATHDPFSSSKRLELLDLLAQGERSVDSFATEADIAALAKDAQVKVQKAFGIFLANSITAFA